MAAGLLESVLENTPQQAGPLPTFLREAAPWRALELWLNGLSPARAGERARTPPSELRAAIVRWLTLDIAAIDRMLDRQLQLILHHAAFQKLEASWRGLRYLTGQLLEVENVKVRMLDVSWRELARDLDRAIEFDQSQLFRKVYSDEFGTPGGEPFGVLLGDYEVAHTVREVDDLRVLGQVAQVAAAAFAPFLAAAHPILFGLESFTGMDLPVDLSRSFQHPDYARWRALRDTEDARFCGLLLPRILLRAPWPDGHGRADGFPFRERATSHAHYLWGNAVYAFGAVLIRAFGRCGWLADIRGVRGDGVEGGTVPDLPAPCLDADLDAPRFPLEVCLTDRQEQELADLGFITLCPMPGTTQCVFHGNASIQKPKVYAEAAATLNARLSAMLQYILCASRFAHYIKVIGREKVGSFLGTEDCESYLARWLLNYSMSNDQASPEMKARHPLRDAKVSVKERPGRPGSYACVAHLSPHYQLDQVVSTVRLVTELTPGRG